MNRSAVRSRLQIKYRNLIDDMDWSESEITDSLGLITDDALRLLDYEESELPTADVPQADVQKYLAALDYYALQAFADAAAPRTSTSVPGPVSVQSQQAFQQIVARLERAKEILCGLGLDPTRTENLTSSRLTLDFKEPRWSPNDFGGCPWP